MFQKLIQKIIFPSLNTNKYKSNIIADEGTYTERELRFITLQKIAQIVVSELDFEKLTQKIVDVMVTDMDYFGGILFLPDKHNNILIPWTTSDTPLIKQILKWLPKPFREFHFPLEVNNKIVETYLEKKLQETKDLADFISPIVDISLVSRIIGIVGIKSTISVPILYHEEVIGVLMLNSSRELSTSSEKQMLQTFSDQIAIAIYNARLFQQSQQQIHDLEAQNRDLASLYHLTSSVSKSLDPKVVAQLAVDAIPHEDEILTTIINEYNPQTGIIKIRALSKTPLTKQAEGIIGDFSKIEVDTKTEEFKNNPTFPVISRQEAVFTNKLEEALAPAIPKQVLVTLQKLSPFKSRYDFPLISRGNMIGFVSYYLRFESMEEFDNNFEQLLKTYTNQIAIAIDNAELFERLEIKKLELEQALATVEEARRKERDMLDVMGHELRTPISIVRNAMLMAQKRLKKDGTIPPDKLEHYVETSVESVRREIKLIETLLTTAKVEGKRIQLDMTKVDLKEVIEDSFEGHKDQIHEKNTDIKVVVNKPDSDVFVYADKVRTQEIMDNFFSNALKYTGSGEIIITLSEYEGFGRIDVKDTGIGISENNLKNLGRKFFRAHGLYSSNFKGVKPSGTGLGLYVTFELAKTMGGKHEIASVVGEGSTFSFLLPLYQGQPDKHIDQTFMEES